ncbi:MAG: radical SAM protein [Bacteroidales bacterium]|nr:radical SAM protein [Bacteroidales bacterium]
MNNEKISAKFIGINRHRINRDGKGVTTLAAFYGCPLRCRYCINPQCFSENIICQTLTPERLKKKVMIDDLYFQATGGGITFGGGEPCLQSRFIEEFHRICNPVWNINIETSLNVETGHIARIAEFVSQFIIDVKDMNSIIYQAYTSADNKLVIKNLQFLAQHGFQNKCRLRLPLITGYNTFSDIEKSKTLLSDMGFYDFDIFEYKKIK